jgi:drug/metabolite transporter (DMT)-like permease
VGIRFALAATVFAVIVRVRRVEIPRTREAHIIYAALGLFTFTFPFALVYWAQQYIPSALSSIMFAGFPFLVALFSHLLLPGERLTGYKVAGILLGFSGLLLIFAGDVALVHENAVPALVGLLGSMVMQAFSTVLVRKYGQPVSPFAMNLVGMSTGAILLLPAGLLFEDAGIVWDAAAVGSILYLAIFGSVVAFATYHWLIKRIEVVYLSLTSFVNPIIAVVLGALILGERLSPGVLGGAGLVLSGILVANGAAVRAWWRRRDD